VGAAIEGPRGQLGAQEAAGDAARVTLGSTVIRAPIDGRTGAVAVKVGGLATANNAELMTIARVEPIYVTFAVPAVHLSTIKNHIRSAAAMPAAARRQETEARPAARTPTVGQNVLDH